VIAVLIFFILHSSATFPMRIVTPASKDYDKDRACLNKKCRVGIDASLYLFIL
jgi:hypothetical protein